VEDTGTIILSSFLVGLCIGITPFLMLVWRFPWNDEDIREENKR